MLTSRTNKPIRRIKDAVVAATVLANATNLIAYLRYLMLLAAVILLAGTHASAQCPVTVLASDLRDPLGITQSNQNNLIVAETGTRTPDSGRISIIDTSGNHRTLLDGLPSAINDVNEPSGPAGVFMRGRTLYVVIGIGNGIAIGPFPGTAVGNPNPSSPIFSSILAIHFSADVEKSTDGFTLTADDQQTLAAGAPVKLSDGSNHLTIKMIANFPNFTPNPLPAFANNVRGSNPFDLAVVDDQIYVTDGGQNTVRQVDIPTGSFSTLVTFQNMPNSLFGIIGGPFIEPVPTGIRYVNNQLLVTLFRGFPFPPGSSVVEQVDPTTGDHGPYISGLKTAIDSVQLREGADSDYLVLQHTSGEEPPFLPPFERPGLLLRFDTPSGVPTVLANCLSRPTSLTIDEKTDTVYVTEFDGRVLAIPIT